MAVDLYAGLLLVGLEVLGVDVAEIGNVSKVEADGLSDEHVERHLVDAGSAPLDVTERVNVCPDVIHHRDEGCAAAKRILRRAVAPSLHLIMGEVREDDRTRKELVRRHIVGERHREVDDSASHDVHPNSRVCVRCEARESSPSYARACWSLFPVSWSDQASVRCQAFIVPYERWCVATLPSVSRHINARPGGDREQVLILPSSLSLPRCLANFCGEATSVPELPSLLTVHIRVNH